MLMNNINSILKLIFTTKYHFDSGICFLMK